MSTSLAKNNRHAKQSVVARLREQLLERAGNLSEIGKGAILTMGIRVVGAGLAYASQILLARWMGAFEFGIYAYAWVWVMVIGYLLPLGLNKSVVRFVPEYAARGRWPRVLGIIRYSRLVIFAMAVVVAAVGSVAILNAGPYLDAHYVEPLLIALACMPLFALIDLHEGLARGFGWVTVAFTPTYIVRPLLLIVGVGLVFLVGGTPSGTVAVGIACAASAIALIGQTTIFERKLAARGPRTRPRTHPAYWARISLPFLLVEAFILVLENTDLLMLGMFLEPDQVGVYFVAARTAALISFVFFAVSALAVPKYADLYARGRKKELEEILHGSIGMIFWPSLAVAAFVIVFGEFLLGFLGEGFAEGYPVIVILALGLLVRAATGPLDFLLNMTGAHNACAVVLGGSAILNVLLNLVLIPSYGLEGAAISTAISLLATSLALHVLVRRRLGIVAFVVARKRFADGVSG